MPIYPFSETLGDAWLIVESVILFVSLVANICLNIVIWYQERNETERLVSHVLEDLASMYCIAELDVVVRINEFYLLL